MDTSKHKFPKKLGHLLYYVISEAVRTMGTYEPNEIFFLFEENLTAEQSLTVYGFLEWIHKNNKAFGSGNYEMIYAQFLASRK